MAAGGALSVTMTGMALMLEWHVLNLVYTVLMLTLAQKESKCNITSSFHNEGFCLFAHELELSLFLQLY